jgi:hypothetical protein
VHIAGVSSDGRRLQLHLRGDSIAHRSRVERLDR